MSREMSVQIVGPGPIGATVMTLDGTGASDVSSRKAMFINTLHREILAASVSNFVWTCQEGIWQVQYVSAAVTVAGGSGASVTVTVCPQTAVAPSAGTAQLTAVIPLTAAGPGLVTGTLITTPTPMTSGDSIALLFAGTLTALVGSITITLKRTS